MDRTGISTRRPTPADAYLLTELGARTFSYTFAANNTPENMATYLAKSFYSDKQAAELDDPTSLFLIAEVEGEAVGYARLKRGKPPKGITGRKPVEIVRFYAREDWIGRGVGKALMQACLIEAEAMGCDTIWLGVWERNPRAIRFYRKWGFVDASVQTFQLGDDRQNDLLMQRSLILDP